MRKILLLILIVCIQFSFVGSEYNEKQLINLKVISLFNIIQKSNESTFTHNDIEKEDYLDIYLAVNTNIKTNRNDLLKNKAFIESFEQIQKNRFESFNKIKKTSFNINWKEAKIEAVNIEADISERFNKSYRSTIIFSSNSRFYGINFDGIVDLNNNIQIQNFRPPYEFFKEFNFDMLLQKN